METNRKKKEEKILKFLIFLGLTAILISLYIQYIKPFSIELTKRQRDKTRIENLSLINSTLKKIQKDNYDIFLSKSNTVYISLSSNKSDCSDLKLPQLPKEWIYACKSKEVFRKTNGSGWLPIDFTKLIENVFMNSLLPVDPINTTENGYYYIYLANNEEFGLIAQLESYKYSSLALKDDGIDPLKFEIGSSINLLKTFKLTEGLKAYWNFDEGEDEIFNDISGYNNKGNMVSLTKDDNWVKGIIKTALNFDGIDDYATVKDHPSIQNIFNKESTILAWINPASAGKNNVGSIIQKDNDADSGWILYVLDQTKDKMRLGFLQRFSEGNEAWITDRIIPINSWTHIALIYKNLLKNNPIIYINGESVIVKKTTATSGNAMPDTGIDPYIGNNSSNVYTFKGSIDEIIIYDRPLSKEEVNLFYKSF